MNKSQSPQLTVSDCFIGSDTPYKIAMKDILEYLHSQNIQIVDEKRDV